MNPPKFNIQEVQEPLSSRPKGDSGQLPIFQDFSLVKSHPCIHFALLLIVIVSINTNCLSFWSTGLATHEPYFTIIREEFKPNQKKPCELCNQIGK